MGWGSFLLGPKNVKNENEMISSKSKTTQFFVQYLWIQSDWNEKHIWHQINSDFIFQNTTTVSENSQTEETFDCW